jgi:hypothetical protein
MTPRRHFLLTAAEYWFKPPASGILRTNKQIYHEAIEILYSKNIFKFRWLEQLFAFEDQIGSENCMRVREMSIWMRFPHEPEVVQVLNPEHALRSEYDSVPSHWITALKACRLATIVHLGIEAQLFSFAPTALHLMPEDLQQFIEGFLGRVAGGEVPHLSLRGFREEEREKFPRSWEVVMDPWGFYKSRLEKCRSSWMHGLLRNRSLILKNELPTSISSELRAH